MSARLIDIITELGHKLANRGLDWYGALSAAAREPLVDRVVLQSARVILGDDWARAVYEIGRDPRPDDIFVDDLAELKTEPGSSRGMTVSQLMLQLAAARVHDPDVGSMRLVDANGADIREIGLALDCGCAEGDDRYVVMLR